MSGGLEDSAKGSFVGEEVVDDELCDGDEDGDELREASVGVKLNRLQFLGG